MTSAAKTIRRYTRHARHNALALASLGVHVFPLELKPLYRTENGWKLEKVYLRGVLWGTQATTKRKQIKQWWNEYPDAVVGIATGPSRLATIDRDDLATDLGELPETFTYSTARGGRHHLYRAPDGVDIKSAPLTDVDGNEYLDVDMKAHGGMVVLYADQELDPQRIVFTPLPKRFIVRRDTPARGDAGALVTGREATIVDEWMQQLDDAPTYSDTLADAVRRIPDDGTGDNLNLVQHFGPLVRACWIKRGARQAMMDGMDRWMSAADPRDVTGNRRDMIRGVATCIEDARAEMEKMQRLAFDTQPTTSKPPRKNKKSKNRGKKKAKRPAEQLDHDEYEPLGQLSLAPSPAQPVLVARELLAENVLPPFAYWREAWHIYQDGHWSQASEDECMDIIYRALADAHWLKTTVDKSGTKDTTEVPWAPGRARVAEVLRAIQVERTLEQRALWPLWLDGRDAPAHLVPAADGLLDPRTGRVKPRSWHFFSLRHIPVPCLDRPKKPKHWLRFLHTVWGEESDQITLLQEWLGYLVSGDTNLQKYMVIVGPTRSGKGTIGVIAEHLIGAEQTIGKGLQALSEPFGLASFRNASLAVFSDARAIDASGMRVAAQRILEITGEDKLEISRKHREDVSERIRARLMILSNQLPTFYDDSGVIADRTLVLRMTESFQGREDLGLKKRLLGELPAILDWALEGYARLRENQHFTQTTELVEARETVRKNAAGVLEFIEEDCIRGDDLTVNRDDLWRAWREWCARNDLKSKGSNIFKNALAAVGIQAYQPKMDDGTRPRLYRGIALRDGLSAQQRAQRMWGNPAADIVTETR